MERKQVSTEETGRGGITPTGGNMGRINKTGYYGGCGGVAPHKRRELSRSFDTLEEAQTFAEGKAVTDIYRKNGRYTVVWIKTITIND